MTEIDLGLVVGGGGEDKMDKVNPSGTGSLSLNRRSNTTIGDNSTALGDDCEASGYGSHAEGFSTHANGQYSHAEGVFTHAVGKYSHAEGNNTSASSDNQHVQGKYNIHDTEGKYAHIVGNGTASDPSNAHTLDWDGNAWFSGGIFCGGSSGDAPNVSMGSDELNTTAKTLTGAVNELKSGKVDAVSGKGLSTKDFTAANQTKLNAIGGVTSNKPSSEVSPASGTYTKITSISLSAGTYLIYGMIQYANNANGYRAIGIGTTLNADSLITRQLPVSGSATNIFGIKIVTLSSTTTINLVAYQNSGSALRTTTASNISAIRLA